jgi:hypothetical protein
MSAGLDMFHPEIAFGAFMPDASEEVVADGREELAAFMREWLAQWSDFRLIGEDFGDADYKVLVAGRQVALGRRSWVEVGLPVFSIWTFRAEEVVRLKFTPSREVALAAAGLTE